MWVIKKLSFLLVTAILQGCGGGGGGESSTSPTNASTVYSLVTPTTVTALGINSNGAASFPAPVNDYGYGIISILEERTFSGTLKAVTSPSMLLYPVQHLIDTNATAAWALGWTGKGQNISVIDDFNTTSNYMWTTPYILREKDGVATYGTYTGAYNIKYRHVYPSSHGALVANIVGGDYDGSSITITPTLTVNEDNSRQSCTNRVLSQAWSWCASCTVDCSNSFYTGYSATQSSSVTYKKVAGIAKEALVITNNVNLSSSQNPIQTVADLQGHIQNNASSAVINLSLGSQIPTSGRSFAEVMAEVERTPLPTNITSVIVVAAGNGGAPCATNDLNGCNAVAVAAAFQKETRESTIVAGALEGSGSSENIATYSTRAGILADRFLLAPGGTGYTGVVGTSFAAPRIAAAAAILKHRYPSLSSKEISNILLLSAKKDINNDGVDDFTGVHPVFGHGKLDLDRALNLVNSR